MKITDTPHTQCTFRQHRKHHIVILNLRTPLLIIHKLKWTNVTRFEHIHRKDTPYIHRKDINNR